MHPYATAYLKKLNIYTYLFLFYLSLYLTNLSIVFFGEKRPLHMQEFFSYIAAIILKENFVNIVSSEPQ